MKKMMKSVMCIALALSMVFCASGCQKWVEDKIGEALNNAIGDTFKEGPKMTYGDFVYCYVTSADSNRRAKSASNIAILELTKEAEEKETIVIPETIEGKPVILIGMSGLGWSDDMYGRYKKLYLSNSLLAIRPAAYNPVNRKIFLLNMMKLEFFVNVIGIFYVSEDLYPQCQEIRETIAGDYPPIFYIANLTYIVDEEVYWIDDYEEGEYITFPQNPQKEGYTFDGWYKDAGCQTEWNEAVDCYDKPEDVNTVNLYAKWIENES